MTAIQSIVSRNVAPLQAAVISVTMIHGGDAFNIIPSQVELQGTIRTYDPDTRKIVLERFNQVVVNSAASLGCQADIHVQSITPAVVNDEKIAQQVQRTAKQALAQGIIDTEFRTMGSEDMAFILQEIPGCFIFVGSGDKDKGICYGLHHPRFDMDERALTNGAAIITAATLDFLQ